MEKQVGWIFEMNEEVKANGGREEQELGVGTRAGESKEREDETSRNKKAEVKSKEME